MLSIQAYLERGDGPIVLVMSPTRFDPSQHVLNTQLIIYRPSVQRACPANPRAGYEVCRAM